MVSTAPLALRFPKQHTHMQHVHTLTDTEVIATRTHLKGHRQEAIVVAPRKYSEVSKVVFHVAIRNFHASSSAILRLRVWVASASGIPSQPDVGEILPGQRILADDLFTVSAIVGRRFTHAETEVVVPAQSSGAAAILTQEFDLFDAGAQDFFTAWNTPTGIDDHIRFEFSLELIASPSSSIQLFNFGYTVVQAPSPANNTVSYAQASKGHQITASAPNTFDRNISPNHDQIRGNFRWQYNAAEWDGIQGIYLWGYYGVGAETDFMTVEVQKITNQSQNASSSTTIWQKVFNVNLQEFGVVRSDDLLSLLADGDEITADYLLTAGAVASGGITATSSFMIEVVQRDCSKTNSYFHVGSSVTRQITGITNADPVPALFANATVIDPRWFANYPDALFSRRQGVGSIAHTGSAVDPDFQIVMDPNLTGDKTASLILTQLVVNTFNATPIAGTFKWALQRKDFDKDPINFAGLRMLYARIDGSWASSAMTDEWDHPGNLLLVYAFSVPNTEVLDLGPLFPVGEFFSEGCASTSAGLGDPGVLVITNGASIPKKFDPVAGVIEDAGIPLPFEGEFPTSIVVNNSGASPEGGITPGAYVYRYTFRNCCTGKESDPNPDDFMVDSAAQGASPAASHSISFAGVRIPADPQICEICLYRTVKDGNFPIMAKVGCFNIDETSVFVDTVPDSELDFFSEGLSLLNGPMPCVPVVVEHRNRLFGLGDIPQLAPAGTVTVTKGSDIITGDGDVTWDRCLEGKFIKVGTDCRIYEIERVLPPVAGTSPAIARLKLVEEYEGVTDTALSYAICGHQNRLWFSEPLEPECWPNINFLDVEPGDGDKLIGGASNFDTLVICKKRKTYVLRFRENPLLEVVVPSRVSTDIGCIAPRSFAQVENGTVWLSDRGLVMFDGRGVMHIDASDRFNEILIDPDNPNYVRRDGQGRVMDAVGVFYPKREQYLLLLPTVKTSRGANLMLVWDTSLNNITLFEFCQEFQSMVVALDTDGNQRVYMGDVNGFVWMFDVGDNDGVGFPNETGTVRGTVSAADVEQGASFLEDENATFLDGGLPQLAALSGVEGLTPAFGTSPNESGDLGLSGVCVYTRAAGAALDDPWIERTIYAATATRLYVSPSWGEETPSVGDDYMIGAIAFNATFKPSNLGTDDAQKRDWKHIVTFEPESVSSRLRVELLPDFSAVDDEELTVLDEEGVAGEGRTFDLQYARGRIRRPVGRRVYNYMQVRMSNFAPDEPIRVLNHTLLSSPRSQ